MNLHTMKIVLPQTCDENIKDSVGTLVESSEILDKEKTQVRTSV